MSHVNQTIRWMAMGRSTSVLFGWRGSPNSQRLRPRTGAAQHRADRHAPLWTGSTRVGAVQSEVTWRSQSGVGLGHVGREGSAATWWVPSNRPKGSRCFPPRAGQFLFLEAKRWANTGFLD